MTPHTNKQYKLTTRFVENDGSASRPLAKFAV